MPPDQLGEFRYRRDAYLLAWERLPPGTPDWPTYLRATWLWYYGSRRPADAPLRPGPRDLGYAIACWANELQGWYSPARQAARALGSVDPPPCYPHPSLPELRIAAMHVVQHAPPTRRWARRRARCLAFLT